MTRADDYRLGTVTHHIKQGTPMTADVKRLSNAFQRFGETIRKEIDAAEAEVSAAETETKDAVNVARGVVKTVRDDAAALRAMVGGLTNSPPADGEEKKKGWQ